jgi:hypothetical protein
MAPFAGNDFQEEEKDGNLPAPPVLFSFFGFK